MTIKRDQIIGKKRPTPVQKMDAVPGWEGDLWVRRISPREEVQAEHILRENDGKPQNLLARLAVLFAADENGNRVFTDDDAVALGDDPSNSDAVSAIFTAGLTFNRMTKGAKEAEKKDSPPIPSD